MARRVAVGGEVVGREKAKKNAREARSEGGEKERRRKPVETG